MWGDNCQKRLKTASGKSFPGVYDKAPNSYKFRKILVLFSKRMGAGCSKNCLVARALGEQPIKIDWEKGQKTGFSIDSEKSKLLGSVFQRKKVLNPFCYYLEAFFSPGFASGASEVSTPWTYHPTAIELTEENIWLERQQIQGKHESKRVLMWLKI